MKLGRVGVVYAPGTMSFPRLAVLAALALLVPRAAAAQSTSLLLESVAGRTLRVDGGLRDWQGIPFRPLGSSPTSSMRYALAGDARGIYVAADVSDERLVRTSHPGPQEDAVVVTLASPAGEGWVGSELWLFAGVSGRSAAEVQVGPVRGRARKVATARIVEAPTPNGYSVEAFIPWDQIPGASDWQRGRARIRLVDVDVETRPVPTETASAEIRNDDLRTLPVLDAAFGEPATIRMFLRDRSLGPDAITQDLRADVAGDARPERILFAGSFFAVMGLGYLDGNGYDFASLGHLAPPGVTNVALLDFTGDGKSEVFVTAWVTRDQADHHEARVYSFEATRIAKVLDVAIGYRDRNGEIGGSAALEPARGESTGIRIRVGEARGITQARYSDQPPSDTIALLLPWGDVASRLYRYDGRRDFEEVASEPIVREPPPQARADAGTPSAGRSGPPSTGTRPTAATPPPAPTFARDPLVRQLRQERGIPANVPERYLARADVAEDSRPEEVFVLGKGIAILGPGFAGGQRFFFMELGVASPDDIVALTTGDATGDGKHELLVRVRQPLSPPYRLELLLVYTLDSNGMRPVLQAQVGMTDGTQSIANETRVAGRGRTAELVIAPGRAQGFSAATWRFADANQPGLEPLLLPWRDRERHYRWDGRAFVRQ